MAAPAARPSAAPGALCPPLPSPGWWCWGVPDARNRLYLLVDAVRDEGRVTVMVKRDAKAGLINREALIGVELLDAGEILLPSGRPCGRGGC